MSSPKFLRMVIAGVPVTCTDLTVEPLRDGMFRLTVTGKNYPEKLRQTFGMGSEITIVSETDGVERFDRFIAQDTPDGRENPDKSFQLVIEATHQTLSRRSPKASR